LKISVVGLGKIGLPLAAQFASRGHEVFGCDIDTRVVEAVNTGVATFSGEPGLEDALSTCVSRGLLKATTETSLAVSQSDAVVVVVPLLVNFDGEVQFEILDAATEEVGRGLRPGTLVSLETTVPVGTTRKRVAAILEKESGLIAGTDFSLVFSPERVYSGRIFENLRAYPKLVGGVNQDSADEGVEFYRQVLTFDERADLPRPNGVWDLGSTEAAELAKLAETTYRDVNIALANQFALYSEKVGIDVYKVIEACNSQPFSQIHQPGIAVGGHCIPVYPHMYLQGDPEATVVKSAREANKKMPVEVIKRAESELGSLRGMTVAILGLAYRGGVKEHAFSGAWSLADELKERGAVPQVVDPMYSDQELNALGFEPCSNPSQVDLVIVQSNHEEFKELRPTSFPNARLVIDGRNFLAATFSGGPQRYLSIGIPG
jgi:nucleotide sugar dehydrogenase